MSDTELGFYPYINDDEGKHDIATVTMYAIARIFEDEMIQLTGDCSAKYKIYRDCSPETETYINIHIGINHRMNKVYVETVEGQKLRELTKANHYCISKAITEQLYQYFLVTKRQHKYKGEIILPEDSHNFCCDNSHIFTCHTIGYSRSIGGKYFFVEDREQVKLDMRNKGIGYNRKEFYDKVHALNEEYNITDVDHYLIPEVFEAYKELYYDEFGVELEGQLDDSYTRISCIYDESLKE